MRVLLILWLSGCSLVWNPDSYRADADTPTDGALDTGLDAARDAADVGAEDASTDGLPDVMFDSNPGGCTEIDMVPETEQVRVDDANPLLASTRIDYDGTDYAVEITASNTRVQDVEIVLTSEGGGIRVAPGLSDVTLTNVRVVFEGDPSGMRSVDRHALLAVGNLDGPIDVLTVTGFESDGLEGLRIANTRESVLTGIRVIRPRVFGDVSSMSTNAIEVVDCQGVAIEDFTVEGQTEMPQVENAVLLRNVDGVRLRNGYIEVPTRGYSLYGDAGPGTNTIEDVAVTSTRRPVELRGSSVWELVRVQVRRLRDCSLDDYAYNVASAPNASYESCTFAGESFNGCASSDTAEGVMIPFEENDVERMLGPVLDYCFTRSSPVYVRPPPEF